MRDANQTDAKFLQFCYMGILHEFLLARCPVFLLNYNNVKVCVSAGNSLCDTTDTKCNRLSFPRGGKIKMR